jgi:hypothetical protein
MFGFEGQTRADQRLVDETQTLAIQQLLLLEWCGPGEADARLELTQMLDEADACGRQLQKGQPLSPEEHDGLLEIRRFLRARRAKAMHTAKVLMVAPDAGDPPCRLVRSR